jgi:putative transposase
MKKNRNIYHTNTKIAFKLNLLPKHISSKIPKSTKHRFLKTDFSNYFGINESEKLENNLEFIKEFNKTKILFNTAKAIIKAKNTIIKIKDNSLNKFDKMKLVISTIDNIKENLSLEKACRLLSISKSKYYSWCFQINYQCHDSFIGKCIKWWPNQISKSTINKIKDICSNKYFNGWPIASIAYFCKNNNILNLSLPTWYKYTKLLNISKKPPKSLKKRKIGIRALIPNQIWHVDVTIYKTLDNVNIYIYLIVDNYSRYILSCKASLELSAKTRLDTIKKLMQNMERINLTILSYLLTVAAKTIIFLLKII